MKFTVRLSSLRRRITFGKSILLYFVDRVSFLYSIQWFVRSLFRCRSCITSVCVESQETHSHGNFESTLFALRIIFSFQQFSLTGHVNALQCEIVFFFFKHLLLSSLSLVRSKLLRALYSIDPGIVCMCLAIILIGNVHNFDQYISVCLLFHRRVNYNEIIIMWQYFVILF